MYGTPQTTDVTTDPAFEALKEGEQEGIDKKEDHKEVASVQDILQALPTQPVSIASFVDIVQRPRLHARPLFVTGVEWQSAPSNEVSHEYVIIRASTAPQNSPIISVRVDRFGGLGCQLPWWRLRPSFLGPNTQRAATVVAAGPVGDRIADPSRGSCEIKYTHWTQELPPAVPTTQIQRALERARNNACATLNYAIRPLVPSDLDTSNRQIRRGRRWADSRGLQFLHTDVASLMADAMDVGILRCGIQMFWAKILRGQLWKGVQRSVSAREEYWNVVRCYRQELRRIAHSLLSLDSNVRLKILRSWGIDEDEVSPLLIQLLNQSLSRQTFVSPHAPMACLTDVASRLDSIIPLLPLSGATNSMCTLHSKTLMARFPDELWHAYTTSVPRTPISTTRAIWHRAKNSHTFWLVFEILIQWVFALALLPIGHLFELWVFALPIIHVLLTLPWTLRERKSWRRIWKLYEGAIVQKEDPEWDDDRAASWLQSKLSLLSTNVGSMSIDIPLQGLHKT